MSDVVNIVLVKKFLINHPRCTRDDFIHPPEKKKKKQNKTKTRFCAINNTKIANPKPLYILLKQIPLKSYVLHKKTLMLEKKSYS
jgi:hypothetical protein